MPTPDTSDQHRVLAHQWAERGQDAAEYALLTGLIALVIAIAVGMFGQSLSAVWLRIATQMSRF